MYRFIFVMVILAVSFGHYVVAQETVSNAEIKLGDAILKWNAKSGLAITYAGRPVFASYPEELTVHSFDWSKAFYKSGEKLRKAVLTKKDDTQVLAISYPDDGFHCKETIIAGPGSKFRVEYIYSQDKWDEAALQLGFSRPVEDFWAGSAFEVIAGEKPTQGVIPFKFNPATRYPFTNATEFRISSLFGSLHWKSSKPVTLWDYKVRNGTLFIGFDEHLQRGKEMTFMVEIEMSHAQFKTEGIVIHQVNIPSKVEDGVLPAKISLSRDDNGPKDVFILLRVKTPSGKYLTADETSALSNEPRQINLNVPVREPGKHQVELIIASSDGREIFRLPKISMHVATLFTVFPGRSPYTREKQGNLLVRTSASLKGKKLTIDANLADQPIIAKCSVEPGTRTIIPFPLGTLPYGNSEVTCRLFVDGVNLAIAKVQVAKLQPKSNEVKIDYVSRGLIVDGLPYFPFGFYCVFPPGKLPDEEITQGFTHIAPYQSNPKGHSQEVMAQIRQYMDRCAAIGMKVHYDIRAIAQLPPSEEKWRLLKAEVEAIRNHPALLCWYLCDEPAGQGIAPSILDESYRFIKKLDPYHPITMVFCIPARAHEYINGMDIMMADPYPIPNAPVTNVSDVTDMLNRAINYNTPLWIVPQAFGGGEGWKREPSSQEERIMTYLALIHGATGIQYFIRRAPIGNPISPRLWAECRRLSLEVAELTPALLSHKTQPKMNCSPQSVHAAAWQDRGEVVILAANTENHPEIAKLYVEGINYTGKANVLFENRQVDVENGVIEEAIDALDTRAYSIPIDPSSANDIKIDPKNLVVNPSYEQAANVGTPDGCYVSVGADRAASIFVDSRVARHGRHSLRVTTPTEGQGVTIIPFPIRLEGGVSYRLSIWAKAKASNTIFEISLNGIDTPAKQFTLTTDWQEYSLTGKAPKTLGRANINFRLISPGTAWFDLLQLVPIESRK